MKGTRKPYNVQVESESVWHVQIDSTPKKNKKGGRALLCNLLMSSSTLSCVDEVYYLSYFLFLKKCKHVRSPYSACVSRIFQQAGHSQASSAVFVPHTSPWCGSLNSASDDLTFIYFFTITKFDRRKVFDPISNINLLNFVVC